MIRVGCCGWPVRRPEYYKDFSLVEIQETFYNLPRLSTVERWRAAAPETFEFVLKAPQLITHAPPSPTYRRLRRKLTEAEKRNVGAFKPTAEVFKAWEQTLALARALRCRIVVFQCPPSFTPTDEHRKNLEAFFGKIERAGLLLAWEPRGEWKDEEIKEVCKRQDLIHCLDPFQRLPASGGGEPAYFRLHGRGGYRYQYTEWDLIELLGLCRQAQETYVLFNNTAMWQDARRFQAMLH
jgi:uncharacterized protein YecE (DUF72 family)